MAKITIESRGRVIDLVLAADEAIDRLCDKLATYRDHVPNVSLYTDPNGEPMKINVNADNLDEHEEAFALLIISEPIPKI